MITNNTNNFLFDSFCPWKILRQISKIITPRLHVFLMHQKFKNLDFIKIYSTIVENNLNL